MDESEMAKAAKAPRSFQLIAQLVRILEEAHAMGHEVRYQMDGFGHEREIRVSIIPVGAATKYTTKAPEVAGWYWLRDRDHLEIVQVLRSDSGEMGWDGVTGWQAFQAGWEWRGPIEVPK